MKNCYAVYMVGFHHYVPWLINSFCGYLYIGAAILFLVNMKNFTREAKGIFVFLSFGIILWGIGQLPRIIFNSFDWDPVSLSASVVLFYPLIRFIQLSGIKSQFATYTFFVPMAVFIISVFIGISKLSPLFHPSPGYLALVINTFVMVMLFYAFICSFLIVRNAGSLYRGTFTWLTMVLALNTIDYLLISIIELSGYPSAYIQIGFANVIFVISAIFFIRSAYAFSQMDSVSNKGDFLEHKILLYVLGFASNQEGVIYFRDKVYQAIKFPESPAKQKFLASIYLEVENYLTEKDPIRRLGRGEIRDRVRQRFQLDDDTSPMCKLFFNK